MKTPWKEAAPFALCSFLYTANYWMLLAYLPLYFKEQGITDEGIGLLVALLSITALALVLPFGFLSDRVTPRRLMTIGAGIFFFYSLMIRWCEGFAALFAVVLSGGLGASLFYISLNALYYKHLEEESQGMRIAFYLAGAILGYAAGPFAGGIIYQYWGIKDLFSIVAGSNLLLIILTRILPAGAPVSMKLQDYLKDIWRPEVLFLVLCTFVISSHYGVEQTSFTLLMKKDLQFSGIQIGAIFSWVGIWIAAITILAGGLFDRTRRLLLLMGLSIFVSGLFRSLTASVNSFSSILLIRLGHTLGDAFFILLQGVLVVSIFSRKRLGGNFSFIFFINLVATTIFALLSGAVTRHTGYRFVFFANGILMMGVALVILLSLGRLRRVFRERNIL